MYVVGRRYSVDADGGSRCEVGRIEMERTGVDQALT